MRPHEPSCPIAAVTVQRVIQMAKIPLTSVMKSRRCVNVPISRNLDLSGMCPEESDIWVLPSMPFFVDEELRESATLKASSG